MLTLIRQDWDEQADATASARRVKLDPGATRSRDKQRQTGSVQFSFSHPIQPLVACVSGGSHFGVDHIQSRIDPQVSSGGLVCWKDGYRPSYAACLLGAA